MDWEHYENIAKQIKELEKKQNVNVKQEPAQDIHGDCQYVWAPEKGTATVMYVLAMIFGSIFNARILVWIVATLIYFNCIGGNKK
jgi:hypothetical protein